MLKTLERVLERRSVGVARCVGEQTRGRFLCVSRACAPMRRAPSS